MSKIKKMWNSFVAELKVGSLRAIFFLAILCALPMFIYSILGSIFFGITLEPSLGLWLPFIPSGLCMLYIGIVSFLGLGKWFIGLFKKKK